MVACLGSGGRMARQRLGISIKKALKKPWCGDFNAGKLVGQLSFEVSSRFELL